MESLRKIQQELRCPKNQKNEFGGYYYRSCEDILEAVKPLLAKHEATLTITDELVSPCEGWVFVAATADITDSAGCHTTVTAHACHEPQKKGMDASQVSGAASSYARKYALNGLFLIDDTKDADASNTHGHTNQSDKQSGGSRGNNQQSNQKATKADFERIKQEREKKGLSAEQAKQIILKYTDKPTNLPAAKVESVMKDIEAKT